MPARFTIEGVDRSKPAISSVQAGMTETAKVGVAANEKIAASAKAVTATIQEQARLNVAAAVEHRAALASIAAEYGAIARSAVAGSREQVAAINLAKKAHEQLGTVAVATGKAQVQAADVSVVAAGRVRRAWDAAAAAVFGSSRAAASSTAAAGGALGATGQFTGSASREEKGIARGFASKTTGIGGFIAGPGFIAGAVGAIALKQASDALRSIQEETSQLQGALANSGKAWATYKGQVDATVKSEELFGVKQSETLRDLTALIRVTGSVQKARREETLATNISRGAHVSMSAAVGAIVQAENGRFRGLQRLIGPIKVVKTYEDQLAAAHIKVTNANREQVLALRHRAVEMDKAATIQNVFTTAEAKFAGEARRHMKTAEGATDSRRVAIEKLQVSIARGLLPVEEKFSKILTAVADKMRTSKTLHDELRAVGVILNATYVVLSKTFGFLADILDTRVGNAFKRLLVISVSPAAAIIVHWTQIKHFFEGFGTWLLAFFRKLWDIVKMDAAYAVLGILEPFSHLPGKMGKWARDAKNAVHDEISLIKDDMAKQGAIAGDAWGGAMVKAFAPFLGDLQKQMNALNPAAGTLAGGAGAPRSASSGAPPRPFSQRVFGPTPGLSALNTALPGTKGNPAIQSKGHAGKSYHYSGEALDIGDGGNPAQLISDWNFLYPLRNNFAELIWNPPLDVQSRAPGSGAGYFWGIPGGFTDHTDHIHVAFTGTPKELQNIIAGKTGGTKPPPPKPRGTEESRESFATKTAEAKAAGLSSSKHKKPKKIGGLSLHLDTGKLNQEQQDNARLIYKTAIANGLTPSQALEMVAAAYAESNLMTNALNASSGAFGLFQLLSAGYKKAYEHYLSMGYDPATANTMAIMADYVKYFKAHPNAAPGEAGAAVERSGQGAAFYSRGIGSTFKLTGGSGTSPVDKVAAARLAQAKTLRTQLSGMITDPMKDILADVASRVTSARDTLSGLDVPISAASEVLIGKLATLRTKLDRMLKSGIVSPAAIAAVKAKMREIGQALATGLEDQAVGAERAHTRLEDAVRLQLQRKQEAQMKAFDRATSDHLASMQKAFNRQMQEFDRETQRGLQAFVVAQTPQEGALKSFLDARAASQAADLHAQLTADLQTAIAGGDPKAIAAAQKALDNEALDIQQQALQTAADQSRTAQDNLTKDQQDAYQQRRDDLKQSLQDAEALAEQSYSDQREIARQGLDDLNKAEAQKLDDNLADWDRWLHEKSQRVEDFYKWLKNTYGIGPGDQGSYDPGPGLNLEEMITKGLIARAASGQVGTVAGQGFARGGTVKAPQFIGRGDMIAARLSHNETVVDSSLTDALREMVKGGGSQHVTVVVPGATLLGRDKDVARKIADVTAPEIERRIGYRPTL